MGGRFVTRFRARSYELDMLGHVNNAVFLNWLEQARLQLLEELGWPVEALIDGSWVSNVVRIEIDYRRPVRYGDEVELDTVVEKIGRTSITLAHELRRRATAGEAASQPSLPGSPESPETSNPAPPVLVAEARAVVVWLGADGRPTPVPDEARAALGALMP